MAYRVTDIRVIDPDDFSVFGIEAGKDEVSLLTCTPYGVNTRRLVVTGERVDIPDPAPAPDDVPLARPAVVEPDGRGRGLGVGRDRSSCVGVAGGVRGDGIDGCDGVRRGACRGGGRGDAGICTGVIVEGIRWHGHGTPNQTFVNAANGFEVGDNSPDDGVVSSGDLVLYRLDLGFTAASARSVRVRWDLADAPYLEGGTEFCYSGAQVTASVQDDGSCVFTVPAGVAESVSRQIVLRGRDTGARVVDGQRARLWVERVSRARNGSWVADGEKQMRPADPVTVVSAPAAGLVVRDYEPKGAERRSSWSGEGADASATGYVDLDVVPLAYPGWSSHGASTGGKWQASVNVGAFPEGTSWLLVAGSGEDSSSWPLTVTDGMLRLPRISGDARLEWTLPASALTDDWERGATRTFDIQVIPDEDAFAVDDAHLLNLGTGGEPGRAQGRDVDSRNDDYGSLTGYPYPNNDWSRAIVVRPGDGDSMSGKLITRPWTRGTTLFDTASMEFAAAASQIDINASGQLGVTGGNHQPTPVDGIRAKAIAAGVYGEYIVALDGTVYASGTNGGGQLGRGFLADGDEGRQHVFQPVEGLKASRVWAGEHSAVALGEDGRMYAWGGNGSRQLGRTGSAATVPEPFAGTIPGTPVEVSIGALQWMGWEHIMMLQDDGTIVGWGNNSHTVLGGPQSQDPSQPVTVEARGSQATPATDPTAQDVAPVSERNETRADGGRDVVRAYTLPAAVAPGRSGLRER